MTLRRPRPRRARPLRAHLDGAGLEPGAGRAARRPALAARRDGGPRGRAGRRGRRRGRPGGGAGPASTCAVASSPCAPRSPTPLVHAATRRPFSSVLARLPATAGLQLPDLSAARPRAPRHRPAAAGGAAIGDPAGSRPGRAGERARPSPAIPPATRSSSSPRARPRLRGPSCTPWPRCRRGCTLPCCPRPRRARRHAHRPADDRSADARRRGVWSLPP